MEWGVHVVIGCMLHVYYSSLEEGGVRGTKRVFVQDEGMQLMLFHLQHMLTENKTKHQACLIRLTKCLKDSGNHLTAMYCMQSESRLLSCRSNTSHR